MLPLSFEFFPPKTAEQRETLEHTAQRLKPLSPDYVSCTFGAGGSTLSYTYDTVVTLKQQNVTAYGKQWPLSAGMRLDADILQETRRLWEWMLEPLYSVTGSM